MKLIRFIMFPLSLSANAHAVEMQSYACDVQLPKKIQQGQLLIGRAPIASALSFAGRTVKQAPSGEFVFGVGRDAKASVLRVKTAAGCNQAIKFDVAKRSYKVEKFDGVPQNTVTPDPETAKRVAREGALIQAARATDSTRLDWLVPLRWPAKGRISGVYGSQRIINGTPLSPHLGLDIALPSGTPFVSALPGKVTLAHEDMVMTGKTLVIDHGYGISTIYIHMSRIDVKKGDEVKAGQQLGAIGSTGRSSGPHLHFQIHWYQEKLDPALLLPSL
jgi:murein DD-endopeptidase MepM/ murein hydrolase activator NlpD